MKRISFFVVILCAFLMTTLTANAQGLITISKVGGQFRNDTLKAGSDIKFYMNFNNNTGKTCNISNGFDLFSNDGATWDSTTCDTVGIIPSFVDRFDIAFAYATFSGNGDGLGDTASIFGAGASAVTKPTKQMPIGYNDSALSITAWFTGKAAAGKHLCIDTSFFQPGGTWVWVGRDLSEFFPVFNGAPGRPANRGFCFFIYDVPDLPAMVLNTGAACETPFVDPNLTASHCVAQTYNFDACDPDNNGSPMGFTSTGPGAIDPVTGVWSANTLPVGVHTVTVTAGGGDPVNMTVTATNAAPAISAGCGTLTITNTGAVKTVQMAGTDADACDPKSWSIGAITPAVGATATIDVNGLVTFSATVAGSYTVSVCLTDGLSQPVCCDISFSVAAGSLYGIRIEKTHGTYQGQFEKVDVILESINTDPILGGVGGFDLLIGYDNSALSLQNVDVATSGLYGTCKWEYFTYRYGANGNCSGGCPSGLVRVVGLAETNNGANHPLCAPLFVPTLPTVMFSINFLVTNDRTFECMYIPIRFFWLDCGDNTLSNQDGSQLYIAGRVFDFHDQDVQIDPLLAAFPGWAGVPAGACLGVQGKPAPDRNIDFFDGGIDIVCADSIDARGDINLNNVANEIADAVMFTNYFVKGIGAFGTNQQHIQGSIAASDVNADGLALSVADLVYLIRVIVGDALPYPKTAPVQASYINDNGSLSVDMPMGAAYVVIKGEVAPELLAQNMEMSYGVREGNTHVIIYPSWTSTSTASFVGNFLNTNGAIVSVEMATADGAPVVAKMVPKNFGLAQNYPNPFNPTTKLSFSLPVASQYTLTVYNVTGQKVAEFSGNEVAGTHSIEFSGESMASGVYFYKLVAGDFSATKKMVMLK